ncbi:MAG: helix-turn-helix domain-containing protein [Clostridia bacterium]|nr:helix-turn-helix domain-containing protein [Clostridia bacterium]
MNEKTIEFKEILRSLLKELDLTQTAFALAIGVKQSQVSEWLSGKAKPGYDNLQAMAKELDVNTNYLLGLED